VRSERHRRPARERHELADADGFHPVSVPLDECFLVPTSADDFRDGMDVW
jgi:hypothetical protein